MTFPIDQIGDFSMGQDRLALYGNEMDANGQTDIFPG